MLLNTDTIDREILTLETSLPRMKRFAPHLPIPLHVAELYWPRTDVTHFVPTEVVSTVVTRARVNHGRWIADCPFCASAQIASRTDPRFWCPECLMEGVGGAIIYVLWPAADKVAEIETHLLRRPNPENRNWATETIDDLRAENTVWGCD